PLAERARLILPRAELRDVAPAAHERRDVTRLRCFGDRASDEGTDRWKASEVILYVQGRLLVGDLELLGEAVCAEPVDDPEVHRLGPRALARPDLVGRQLQHLGRGRRV